MKTTYHDPSNTPLIRDPFTTVAETVREVAAIRAEVEDRHHQRRAIVAAFQSQLDASDQADGRRMEIVERMIEMASAELLRGNQETARLLIESATASVPALPVYEAPRLLEG
ncbi:MAG: hypothetical protein AAF211_30270 [Myxococcota bacterium]